MATKNAPFFSRKPGRPDSIKSHRKRSAALAAAGECGQIWDTEKKTQRQVHESAAGGWLTVTPEEWLGVDLRAELLAHGLIDEEVADGQG